jgi:AraC-like DNA-binding protein
MPHIRRPQDRTLRSQLTPPLLRLVRRVGGDPSSLIARFNLPEDAETAREVLLPLDAFLAFSGAAEAVIAQTHVGLLLAQGMPRGAYGILEYSARSAPSVREAVLRMCRYSTLLNDLTVFSLTEHGGVGRFTMRVPGEPRVNGKVGGECVIAMLVRMARELSGAAWNPRKVWFAHGAPEDLTHLKAFFAADVFEFDRGENGFELEKRFLDAAVVSADPALLQILDEQLEQVLEHRPRPTDLVGEVSDHIRASFRSGEMGIDPVARRMALSARTLQRRLAEQRTSFNAVVDSVRSELARDYLTHSAMVLGEIAYVLGYSELSTFLRAFKRWTGMTPTDFRERAQQRR